MRDDDESCRCDSEWRMSWSAPAIRNGASHPAVRERCSACDQRGDITLIPSSRRRKRCKCLGISKDRFEVKGARSEIDKGGVKDLEADIGHESAFTDSSNAKVEELAANIAVDEADPKAATEMRAKEKFAFQANEKELLEAICTCEARGVQLCREQLEFH